MDIHTENGEGGGGENPLLPPLERHTNYARPGGCSQRLRSTLNWTKLWQANHATGCSHHYDLEI